MVRSVKDASNSTLLWHRRYGFDTVHLVSDPTSNAQNRSKPNLLPTAIAWMIAAISAGLLVIWRRENANPKPEPAAGSEPDSAAGGQSGDQASKKKESAANRLGSADWKFAFSGAVRKFSEDQGTDLAAALTYYAVFALFPALIAVVSLLGVFGQGQSTVDAVLDFAAELVPAESLDTLRPIVESMANNQSAGFGLLIGLVGALWSASAYVGAFGRAMNRVYEVPEGRPFWKLRPANLGITFVVVVLCVFSALLLVITGPVARAVGNVVGLGEATVELWNIAKWPVLLLVVMTIFATLYQATPNVQPSHRRLISAGSVFAVLVWILASLGFGLYVSLAGNYDSTYGSLAGVIMFLLWLWITNLALMLGAELDAELERTRELISGESAEKEILLPLRDTTGIERQAAKDAAREQQGLQLRNRHVGVSTDQSGADRSQATTGKSVT